MCSFFGSMANSFKLKSTTNVTNAAVILSLKLLRMRAVLFIFIGNRALTLNACRMMHSTLTQEMGGYEISVSIDRL